MDDFGAWSLHVRNDFTPIPKPNEVAQWFDLRAAARAGGRAASPQVGQWPARPVPSAYFTGW